MFPWPVWRIILIYANCWNLRLVCGRFKKMIEAAHKFKFTDFAPIIERGTLRILKMYLLQHDYEYYHIPQLKLTNIEIIEHLVEIKIKNKIERGAIYAIETNNVKLFNCYAKNFNLNKRPIIKAAYKYNCFINYFTLTNEKCEKAAIKGACEGGQYELFCKFKLRSFFGLKNALKGGDSRIINEIIKINSSVHYLLISAGAAGSIRMAEEHIRESDAKIDADMLKFACKNNRLEFVTYFKNYLPSYHSDEIFKYAGRGGHVRILEFLADHYGEMKIPIVLKEIAQRGHFAAFQYIVEKYGPNLKDYFEAAFYNGRFEIVKYILSKQDIKCAHIVDALCGCKYYAISDYLSSKIKFCPRCANSEKRKKCPIGKSPF